MAVKLERQLYIAVLEAEFAHYAELLQLRVLRLGLLHDGDVGVGVFPLGAAIAGGRRDGLGLESAGRSAGCQSADQI